MVASIESRRSRIRMTCLLLTVLVVAVNSVASESVAPWNSRREELAADESVMFPSSWPNRQSSVLPRRLEDAYNNYETTYDYFAYDLSQFSLRFEKCQYVKMYDDEVAEDEDSDSPLAIKHFVIYRLCPTDACSTCDEEGVVYGKYVVTVDSYLQSIIETQKKFFEKMCENCQDGCDDGDEECQECVSACDQYENLEDYGYIDAADYTECQQLDVENDDVNNGDDDLQLYIGPRCNSSGKIDIGLFSDERCWDPIEDLDIEQVLGAKLFYDLLSQSYSDEGLCLSCKENNDDGDENEADQEDADDVNEMCEDLYKNAAKCESETGIQVGFIQTNREEGNYENQVENEFIACTFIDSLIWNSYTETGEINIQAPQDEIIRQVTRNQTISLSALSVTIAGLVCLMFYFDRQIKKAEHSQPLALHQSRNHTLT